MTPQLKCPKCGGERFKVEGVGLMGCQRCGCVMHLVKRWQPVFELKQEGGGGGEQTTHGEEF